MKWGCGFIIIRGTYWRKFPSVEEWINWKIIYSYQSSLSMDIIIILIDNFVSTVIYTYMYLMYNVSALGSCRTFTDGTCAVIKWWSLITHRDTGCLLEKKDQLYINIMCNASRSRWNFIDGICCYQVVMYRHTGHLLQHTKVINSEVKIQNAFIFNVRQDKHSILLQPLVWLYSWCSNVSSQLLMRFWWHIHAWCATEAFSTTCAVYRGLWSADDCLVDVVQWW